MSGTANSRVVHKPGSDVQSGTHHDSPGRSESEFLVFSLTGLTSGHVPEC